MTSLYIRYINFWSGFYTNKDDVDRIIRSAIRDTFHKHSMNAIEDITKRPNIVVSSVFGNPRTLSDYQDAFVIIINGENSYGHEHHRTWSYENLRKDGYKVHLYLGFSRQEDDVQKRFPLWLWCYDFYRRNDSLAYQFIQNHSGVPFTSGDLNKRRLAACMCARSNHFHWRSTFYHLCVQNGIEVKCPSSVCHNDQGIEHDQGEIHLEFCV
jgi:hypothetical protein